MNWFWIILALLGALLLIVLEIVAIPGFVVGIIGGALYVFAIWQTYLVYGAVAGNITLIVSLFVGILMLVFFMRSNTWRFFALNDKIDGKVNVVDAEKLSIGSRGKTLSRLFPIGKAIFENEIVEVQAQVDFIEENKEVEIVKIEANKIIVKPI